MPNPPNTTATGSFLMVGDNASLDFLNTVLADNDGKLIELLHSPEAFTAWCTASGLFDEPTLKRLRAAWGSSKTGHSALIQARALRAELAALMQRVISGKAYVQHAVDLLAPYLAAVPLHREPLVEGGRLQIRLRTEVSTSPTDEFLGAIASSALDLLVHADPEHIRKCANPRCVVVFHDTTKNHRRQWCSMEACGNRAKAVRFREKHK
jgi:predicted RNA-binding Zn ribbon-like protein